MKRLLLISCIALGTMCRAQKYTCHIEGITTDPETKVMYIAEKGANFRIDDFVRIPVTDGKFFYDLKTDELFCYYIVPENQYQNGCFRHAEFISENQDVSIRIGTIKDTPIVKGTGKETMMQEQCEKEIGSIYDSSVKSMEAKLDSIRKIILGVKQNMTQEQWNVYVSENDSETSTNPLFVSYNKILRENEEIYEQKMISRAKWLDEHPCFYGLINIKEYFRYVPTLKASVTPYYLNSYKKTYCNMFSGHKYHESIKNTIKAIDLIPGNKYIDYDVCNKEGKQVKISSLYFGKLIYIDLWASWCGSCRRRAIALKPLYEKYKDKGFQVIGIAREQKAENMKKAIDQDGYTWMNLLELKDQNKIWLKNGLDDAGGGGFLIAADGTILAVTPSAEQVESILKERLGD